MNQTKILIKGIDNSIYPDECTFYSDNSIEYKKVRYTEWETVEVPIQIVQFNYQQCIDDFKYNDKKGYYQKYLEVKDECEQWLNTIDERILKHQQEVEQRKDEMHKLFYELRKVITERGLEMIMLPIIDSVVEQQRIKYENTYFEFNLMINSQYKERLFNEFKHNCKTWINNKYRVQTYICLLDIDELKLEAYYYYLYDYERQFKLYISRCKQQ
jgi:hypothetical protein